MHILLLNKERNPKDKIVSLCIFRTRESLNPTPTTKPQMRGHKPRSQNPKPYTTDNHFNPGLQRIWASYACTSPPYTRWSFAGQKGVEKKMDTTTGLEFRAKGLGNGKYHHLGIT